MSISLERHSAQYRPFDYWHKPRSELEDLWVLFTLSGSIFAERHFELAGTNPKNRLGHQVIGYLESIPILGGLIALIEAVVYHLFGSSDTTPKDINHTQNTSSYTASMYSNHNPQDNSLNSTPLITSGQPYGLKNSSGSDCFLIANLQMILNNKVWMDWAEQSENAPKIWKTIAILHQNGTLENNVRKIRSMLTELQSSLGAGQQDASEALNVLLDLLPNDYKMRIEFRRPGREPKTAPLTYIPLPLNESIETYFNSPHPEELKKAGLDGNSILILDNQGNLTYEIETVQTTLHLQNAVPSFIVQLLRFNNDLKKLYTDYPIPPQVDIQTTDAGLITYNLTSITNHIGSTPKFGHYTNYRKVGELWFELNDSASPKNLSEEAVLNAAATSGYILNYSLKTTVSLDTQIDKRPLSHNEPRQEIESPTCREKLSADSKYVGRRTEA